MLCVSFLLPPLPASSLPVIKSNKYNDNIISKVDKDLNIIFFVSGDIILVIFPI